MFEYYKQKKKEEIEKLEKELEEKRKEEQEYDKEIAYINSYDYKKEGISKLKGLLIFFVLFGSLEVLYAIFNSISVFYSCALYLVSIGCAISIKKMDKNLKNKYSDLLNYSGMELEEKKNLLRNKKSNTYYNEEIINNKIRNCKEKLAKLEYYEKMTNILNTPEAILLSANSEEEYNFLKQTQEEKLNHLKNYLEEKVDYANIHFDNSIDENIEYTKNSKKLMKKM